MIAVGVNAGGDSGLSGFALEASSRKEKKKKTSQTVPSIVIAKSNIIQSETEDREDTSRAKSRKSSPLKEMGEDFEFSVIYNPQDLTPAFDPTRNTLFEDHNFELPKGGHYICDNYCSAFIHALNLAACNIVYSRTAQLDKF